LGYGHDRRDICAYRGLTRSFTPAGTERKAPIEQQPDIHDPEEDEDEQQRDNAEFDHSLAGQSLAQPSPGRAPF
jgi:hypothetical protein